MSAEEWLSIDQLSIGDRDTTIEVKLSDSIVVGRLTNISLEVDYENIGPRTRKTERILLNVGRFAFKVTPDTLFKRVREEGRFDQ